MSLVFSWIGVYHIYPIIREYSDRLLATAKKGGLKTTLALTDADLVNQKSKIRLFPNLSGPHRGAALLAQVLVELTIGKKKEEPLPNRRSLPALRAEQGRGP
jgi:hypothetical protein